MPRVRQRPTYCLHKPSGRAYTRVDGRMVYLGDWDSEDSRDRFRVEVENWSLRQNPVGATLTVDDLALRYLKHCQTYYQKDGRDTGETSNVKAALRYAIQECGTVRVRNFGPLKLKQVRQAMVRAKLSRTYINTAIGRIKRMFAWVSLRSWSPRRSIGPWPPFPVYEPVAAKPSRSRRCSRFRRGSSTPSSPTPAVRFGG